MSDDSQSWDEEEIVFLPHIHHNFEIKVRKCCQIHRLAETNTPMHVCVQSHLSGGRGKGFRLAAGWNGDVHERRLLRGKATADVGGHHRTGNH